MSIKEHQEEILQFVSAGCCVAEIARAIGHSENGVRGFLKSLGIEAKKNKLYNASISSIVADLKSIETKSEKFCVYLHRRKSDGTIFYVGQGTEGRAFNSSNRAQRWKQTAKDSYGFTVEIIDKNLSKDTALELEEFLIQEIPNLINLPYSKSKFKDLDLSEVKDRFYYDESSPSCLRHKKDGHKIKADSPAGYQEKNKYWRVKVGKKIHLVHRIIFVLFKNKLSGDSIVDHIDGNPENNFISNLRKTTAEKNCRNRKIRSDNNTGIGGVRRGRDSFSASITIKGRVVKKELSISKYGEAEAFRLIQEWREKILCELNSVFQAGYTERHGT